MKKIYALMLAAACAICLAGCVKEILCADEAIAPATEMIICGTMGDLVEDGSQTPADTPDTRTQVRNTKEVWWNSGDQIAVFMSTSPTANKFTSTLTSGMSKTSYFSGTISKTGSKYYVGYPYSGAAYSTSSDGTLTLEVPSSQTAVSGSFSSNTLPSYGSFTSSSTDFTMKPAAGGLKFHVSRDDIKSVKFEGNNSEKVAGKVTVAKLSKTPDISRGSSGSTSITLKRSSGNLEKDKNYFIVITPGSLSKGFTITLTTEGGESLVVTSTKSRTIKAGVFGTLSKALDEYAQPTPKAVDLGLPSGTMWATFNVGASKPEEYGDYFAWGEIQPKSDYSWSTYKWCNGDYNKLTKYCTDSSYWDGYYLVDNKTVLDSEDDAASANWEGFWRIPTDADWTELRKYCKWTWTDNYNETGIAGRIVTSNMSGYETKSIFLPAAGQMNGTSLKNLDSGYYWSSSLSTDDYPSYAWRVWFTDGGVYRFDGYRYWGFSVRPVFGKLVPVTKVSLPEESIHVGIGKTTSCQVTLTPSNATEKSLIVKMADTNVASFEYNSGTNTITVSGVASGTTTMTVYASSGVSATCEIKVANEPQYVDMGLSVKWATFNLGASAPQETGSYYAWGETEAKSDYNWSTYKYCNGSNTTFTKYNFRSDFGTVDNKSLLDLADDAAHAALGGDWRIPTLSEAKELLDTKNCTWELIADYNSTGVTGYKVTSKKNGNSIFLPQAGCQYGTNVIDSYGYYWVSSSSIGDPTRGNDFYFAGNGGALIGEQERFAGITVRPVYGKLIQVESLDVPGSLTIENGQTVDLPVTVSPANASDNTITLISSDTHLVTCNRLQISGFNAGQATVTAYASNGVSASCVVTVTAVPEYVDLGLSVKWATFNLGAETPDGYGNYYAWGEKDAKSSFSWSNYLWGGSASSISKYNLLSANGTVDHKRTLDFDDDAAKVAWGGDWRLPTLDEFNELKNTSNCTWTWTTQNGKKGYRVTSKKTGYEVRSIFLPAAGSYDGSSVTGTEQYALYWTSTPYTSDYSKSYDLSAQQSSVGFGTPDRYRGLPIRPVYGTFVPATGLTVDASVYLKEGATLTLTPTVAPSNASNKSLEVISSASSVTTYNGSVVKGVGPGTATLTFYTHNGISATCKVTVIKEPEYVDLGLPSGTKWAKWNIGATKPEEYGEYFAWGETEPKDNYSWSTYKFELGTGYNGPFSKYVTDSKYGTVDNILVLELDDDAAHVNWGSNWRMPTDADWTELRENCTWTWTSDYNGTGVAGEIVTSNVSGYEGKSIFLPATGSSLYSPGTSGYYWSSSLFTEHPGNAWRVSFNSDNISRFCFDRYYGHSIRPVKK